jgi:RNA polymerase sigma-70 factor, ECF subfamily
VPFTSVKEPGSPVSPRTQYEEHLPEDHVLIERFQAGDQDAFGDLYRRHHRRVLACVASQVRDHHLAEDLTTEVFIRAFNALPALPNLGRPLDAWLTTIARNLVVDHFRCLQTRMATPMASPALPIADEQNPESLVIDHFQVLAAMADLAPEVREVVVRRVLLDHSVAQTAADLGLHKSKVKHHLRRARQRLGTAFVQEVAVA